MPGLGQDTREAHLPHGRLVPNRHLLDLRHELSVVLVCRQLHRREVITRINLGSLLLQGLSAIEGKSVEGMAQADPGGPGGPAPPCQQDFFKIMQFSGNFEETPILSTFWGQGPLLGSKLHWPP